MSHLADGEPLQDAAAPTAVGDVPEQLVERHDSDREDFSALGGVDEEGSGDAPQEALVIEAATAAPRNEEAGAGVEQRQTPAPEEYQSRIAAITAVFATPDDAEGLAAAGVDAEILDRELTARFGERHAHTVNAREIRGWLALLAGQSAVAARWYLHTTGLQIALHGANHADAEASVRRAVYTWQQVKDPVEVVQVGRDLAKVVTAVLGEGSNAARFVQARLARHQPL
ncbi:hypothetical protein OG982_30065 [Streptomyces sp. NBC_01551]|uniref:hypothetical protein n=1 Tax=Streptomyces sp. NBC_01551 TaxID=2975876 RepID=UPI00225702F7|nr:hypothetical protein [Streptomyces sp. NBC_01551]MCX4529890.1 hypothetical protein [Streptomyces sp. NBC_01551]